MSRAEKLLTRARDAGVTVACAESCTGGLLGAAITALPGSSDIFDRGFVTYSNSAKRDMLGVRAETLETCGAVSEPVAREMAIGALERSQADIAVSITGIAGPGGSDHKPEGRVCFGLAGPESVTTETVEFGPIGRSRVRDGAVDHALGLLLHALDRDAP